MIKKLIFSLGVFFLLAFSPTLMGQSEFVIVPPSAFNCMTSGGGWVKSDSAEQYLYITAGADFLDRTYIAPVYFPPSATGKKVKKMSVTVLDGSDAAGIAVRLRKTDLTDGNNHWNVFFVGTGFYEALGKQLLHDNATSENRTINNRRWAWDIVVTFEFVPSPEDALRVYSVRIKFE